MTKNRMFKAFLSSVVTNFVSNINLFQMPLIMLWLIFQSLWPQKFDWFAAPIGCPPPPEKSGSGWISDAAVVGLTNVCQEEINVSTFLQRFICTGHDHINLIWHFATAINATLQHAIFCHKILCFQIETQFSMIVKEIRHFLQIKFNPIPGGAGGASDAKVKCLWIILNTLFWDSKGNDFLIIGVTDPMQLTVFGKNFSLGDSPKPPKT